MRSLVKFCFITFLVTHLSCSSSDNSGSADPSQIDLYPPFTEVVQKDTILLAVNSPELYYAIPPFSATEFKKNELFVVNSNKLLVAQIDTLGHLIRNITRAGSGPGELQGARSMKVWLGEDGDIYVLTHSNVFRQLQIHDLAVPEIRGIFSS